MSGMEKKDLPHGRCNPCEFAEIIVGTGSWFFLGCCHPPYKGKWVAEIKDCPKERMEGDGMNIHELKTYPHYFQQSIAGNKTFEIRLNDRGFQVGDIVVLKEWDNIKFSGREKRGVIKYILDDKLIGLAKGYVAFSIEWLEDGIPHWYG